ncbi:MAG: sigma-54-dependent Fis family transcriptional regulator, partial [Planctomycetales bacterium]|nr:sigma-54-dependent Fis family transcriptional regulator [Planctomycetales bacterium]
MISSEHARDTQQATVVVVDDDRAIRHLLTTALAADGYSVLEADCVAQCRAIVDETVPCLIFLDLRLPDGSGLDVLKHVRESAPDVPVILMTAAGDAETAILASRFGAIDYLTKPLDLRHLREVVERTLHSEEEREETPTSSRRITPHSSDELLIGRSRELQEVLMSIGRVAQQSVSVLIRGESGTGKELVARAIVEHSQRANEIFLAVNCAAMTNELLESHLFGHEAGAFTGASRRRVGTFELCSRGTLFLDEVGDMHPLMQAKLLRVLQEKKFSRVGGNEVLTTDARIISATNRDLEALCDDGTFREDLYHRLNGFSINVPPLRERGDDVRLLLA